MLGSGRMAFSAEARRDWEEKQNKTGNGNGVGVENGRRSLEMPVRGCSYQVFRRTASGLLMDRREARGRLSMMDISSIKDTCKNVLPLSQSHWTCVISFAELSNIFHSCTSLAIPHCTMTTGSPVSLRVLYCVCAWPMSHGLWLTVDHWGSDTVQQNWERLFEDRYQGTETRVENMFKACLNAMV